MGQGGCYSCMKYLFVFLSIIFLLFGILGIVASAWMLIDPAMGLQYAQEANDNLISIIIILIAGIILLFVGFLGIYSALREVRWAMVLCFALLLIVVVAEVAAIAWGYIHRDGLELHIRNTAKAVVEQKYHKFEEIRSTYDTIQQKLHCCGADKPNDWQNAGDINFSITEPPKTFNIPKSCCRDHVSDSQCTEATTNLKIGAALNHQIIYDKGCCTLIIEKAKEGFSIILGIGGAVLATQLLALMLSIVLAFSMNRSNRYKA